MNQRLTELFNFVWTLMKGGSTGRGESWPINQNTRSYWGWRLQDLSNQAASDRRLVSIQANTNHLLVASFKPFLIYFCNQAVVGVCLDAHWSKINHHLITKVLVIECCLGAHHLHTTLLPLATTKSMNNSHIFWKSDTRDQQRLQKVAGHEEVASACDYSVAGALTNSIYTFSLCYSFNTWCKQRRQSDNGLLMLELT